MTHGGPVDDAGCRFLSSAMHVVPVQTVDVASVRGTSISSGTGKAERSPPSQTSPPSSSTRPHVFTVTASGMCTLWDALDARCVDTLSLHNDSALFAQLPVVLRTLPLRVCASVVVAGASGRSSLSPSSTTTMKTAFGSGTGSASPAHVLLALALDTVLVVRVGTTPMQVAGVLRGLTTAHGDAGIRALNVWSPTGNACAPKLVIMDGHGSLYIWLWSIVDATVIGRRPLAVVPSDVHDSANASAATSFAVNVHNNSLQVALIHHDHIRVLLLPLDLSAEDELLHEALESMGSGSPPSFHHTATFAQAATTLVELRVPAGQRGTITGCSFTAVTSITAWTADGQWFRWHLDGTLQDCSSMIPTNRPRTSQMTAFASDRGMLHTVALRRGVMTYSACDVVRSDEAVLQTSHAITFGRKSTVTAMAVLDDRYVAWGKSRW